MRKDTLPGQGEGDSLGWLGKDEGVVVIVAAPWKGLGGAGRAWRAVGNCSLSLCDPVDNAHAHGGVAARERA